MCKKTYGLILSLILSAGFLTLARGDIFAQQGDDLEVVLDITSNTVALPKIFQSNIDLSGKGHSRDNARPQTLAAPEVLDIWQKDIGFNGVYRLQFNLWEISQLAKDKEAQSKLLAHYEKMIRDISDAGGIVLLDIFGTPKGMGKVLDKRSPPRDLKGFKEFIKSYIREFSCNKKYNIWYEVWSAPDLDDFFLGRKQDYLNLYKMVAEGVKELREETKIYIPVGGPSVSWWFQNIDSNTIVRAEKSLIYELIRFCRRYRLPLDFITWHAYSTDLKTEKEMTLYKNKSVPALIRDWLSYFNLDKNIPLIVDEWNYDNAANMAAERKEKAFISASYIIGRIKNMYEAGLDYQLFFSLEDFQNLKEGVNRNVGVFWFDPESSHYKGGPKLTYNSFKMLSMLGRNIFSFAGKLDDEFTGLIATKKDDDITVLVYNYIDPNIANNYISRNISTLNDADRKAVLKLIKANKLNKIISGETDIVSLKLKTKVKALLEKARDLDAKATQLKVANRNLKLGFDKLEGKYIYQRYVIDAKSNSDKFVPLETKEIDGGEARLYQENLALSPYSVNMIILKKKPQEPEAAVSPQGAVPAATPVGK